MTISRAAACTRSDALGALLEVDTWPAPYRRAWTARLDALEARLDAAEGE